MKENNEIIAEFMGGKWQCIWIFDGNNGLPQNTTNLMFDRSWDWLMPVVEKINNTKVNGERIDVIIYRRTCHINDPEQIIIETTGEDMLSCTYKAVVEFIKFYNEQK